MSPGNRSASRMVQVLARSVHIAAMAMVLGGVGLGAGFDRLKVWVALTVLSGVLLMALDLAKGPGFLHQGSGVALLIKLALLGLGNAFPVARLEWYLAATVVASVGSHMSASWRHFCFREWRVLESGGKKRAE